MVQFVDRWKMHELFKTRRTLLVVFMVATVIVAENTRLDQDDMIDVESDPGSPGFCEVELKNMRDAVKSLASELTKLRTALIVETSSKSELNRVWRLIRNQQALIEKEFANVNAQFSVKVRKESSVNTISTQNSSSMAELFFGGEPYFVQCASEIDPLHRPFAEAAVKLRSAGVSAVALDCHEKLPSGKSTVERFFPGKKIDRNEPFFFVVSNRQKPRSVNMKNVVSTESLVSFIAEATKPKVINIASKEDFREHCLRRKQCAVTVYDGNMTAPESAALEAVLIKHRGIAFVDIDLKKWTLSFEDSLPQTGQLPRLVFLQVPKDDPSKKKKSSTASKQFEGRAYKGAEWDSEKISDFLADVSSGKSKLAKLKKHPAVQERVSPSSGKKASESASKGQDSSRKKTSGAAKEDRAESTKKTPLSSAQGTQSKTTAGRGKRHSVDIGKDGNMRKSWEQQQEDKAAELQRERERRRQMEKEAKDADGIEFVGEDGRADLLEDDMDEDGYTLLPTVEVDFDDDSEEQPSKKERDIGDKDLEAEEASRRDASVQGEEEIAGDMRQGDGAISGGLSRGIGDDLDPREAEPPTTAGPMPTGASTRTESGTSSGEVEGKPRQDDKGSSQKQVERERTGKEVKNGVGTGKQEQKREGGGTGGDGKRETRQDGGKKDKKHDSAGKDQKREDGAKWQNGGKKDKGEDGGKKDPKRGDASNQDQKREDEVKKDQKRKKEKKRQDKDGEDRKEKAAEEKKQKPSSSWLW